MRASIGFCLLEIIILSLIIFCLALLITSLYNNVVSDKITLNKTEWVCTQKESKVSIIGGKVYVLGDCVKYIKKGEI